MRVWLGSRSGIGHVAVGMPRQGYDLQLTRYDRGWRATFYTTGMEHSPTSATGTAWERTPWHRDVAGGVGGLNRVGENTRWRPSNRSSAAQNSGSWGVSLVRRASSSG